MSATSALSHDVGKKAACEAFSVPRATFYRHHRSPLRLLKSKNPDLLPFWPSQSKSERR